MIQIYYGNGKGKTTAAIGAGMRACGAGMHVGMVQFLKNNASNELKSVAFDIFEAPAQLPFHPDKSYCKWVEAAVAWIKKSKKDFIILDEFMDIIDVFLSEDDAIELIDSLDCELVITGHKEHAGLFEKADYITCMMNQKHPFDKGIPARAGIEY